MTDMIPSLRSLGEQATGRPSTILFKPGPNFPAKVVFSDEQGTDEELKPLHSHLLTLQMLCLFLEDEVCSIYEHRSSA